ncbi:hypothetical protein [Paraburkholderia sp. 32]|uniref:hypothetical protein n=1 Tax=Paraburkholderia sp. 32 TaxID=2991057 RepID=UPI003D24C0BF
MNQLGSVQQPATYLLRRERSKPGPLEAMIIKPQLCIGGVDTAVACNRIVYGDDSFGLLLIEAPAVDTACLSSSARFFAAASSSFQLG